MLVKFFSHSKNAVGCLEYMYSEKDHKGQIRDVKPETLTGDPELTQELINRASEKFDHCYTAGCLSFEESDITAEQKAEIMQDFESALLAGMNADEYNCLWVEHRDKGRLELNFVIPKINTENDHSLHVYYKYADEKRIDSWGDIQNIKYGFSDPKEPNRQRLFTTTHDLPEKAKDVKNAIGDYLLNYGAENRSEIIEALSELDGLGITRKTKNSISIKIPEHEKNIRLTGDMYSENFRASEKSERGIEQSQREFKATSDTRLADAISRYNDLHQRAAERNRAKHDRLSTKTKERIAKRDNPKIEQVQILDSIKFSDNDRDNNSVGSTNISNDRFPQGLRDVEQKSNSESKGNIRNNNTDPTNKKRQEKINEVFTDEFRKQSNHRSNRGMESGKGRFDKFIRNAERNNERTGENNQQSEQNDKQNDAITTGIEHRARKNHELIERIGERAREFKADIQRKVNKIKEKAKGANKGWQR